VPHQPPPGFAEPAPNGFASYPQPNGGRTYPSAAGRIPGPREAADADYPVPTEPSSFGISGRHRTQGAPDDREQPVDADGFRWLSPSPTMGQPPVQPSGFGPSPSMGQPAVPMGHRPPPEPPTVPPPAPMSPPPPRMPMPAAVPMPSDEDIAALIDEPEIVPWDRKPLLVVIATVIVLVLIGVIAGFVTAKLVDSPSASWRDSAARVAPVSFDRT
jgi:hypothetical protein